MTNKQTLRGIAALCTLHSALCLPLWAQPTNFTYQGRLNDDGAPANGIYDFQFVIYNVPDSGSPGASALQTSEAMDVPVTNGLFTAAIPFQDWIFNGEQRWLEVQVRTNDSGEYTGLEPWTELTPTPYAVRALNVASNGLAGEYGAAVSFSNPANVFVGDGSGLTDVTLDGLTATDFWQLGGNAGTTAGDDFIGTTDNQALEFKVNNGRALRIENTTTTPNIIGGNGDNTAGSGTIGAVISGGGFVGNLANTIGDAAHYSMIGGGLDNSIGVDSLRATITGGELNDIGVESDWSVVGGGVDNNIGGLTPGGTISGGAINDIGDGADYSAIGGGYDNNISSNAPNATIAGGSLNGIGANSEHSTIGGGFDNDIASNAVYATIAGGRNNDIGVNSPWSAIGGGVNNNIASDSFYATIAGGVNNNIGVDAGSSAIGGGSNNTIASNLNYATIAGGYLNDIGVLSPWSAIGGGRDNNIADNTFYAVIPGGEDNDVGAGAWYALAAGRQAKANHQGAFVWADSQDTNVTSTASDQVTFRARNGFRLTENAGNGKTISIGDQYRDNALLAWGKVGATGTLVADFGVISVTHAGAGDYEIFLTDTAASIHTLIPVAIAEIDAAPASASAARIVSINQDSTTPNRFKVYINNGNYVLVDNDFVFMVTAR